MILEPDGVPYYVKDLDFCKIGASFFIPCINTSRAVKQARELSDELDLDIEHAVRIEDGFIGVRFWRT